MWIDTKGDLKAWHPALGPNSFHEFVVWEFEVKNQKLERLAIDFQFGNLDSQIETNLPPLYGSLRIKSEFELTEPMQKR
jgi:hypothetical protein